MARRSVSKTHKRTQKHRRRTAKRSNKRVQKRGRRVRRKLRGGNQTTVQQTGVPDNLKWNDANTAAPGPQHNAGLYGGKQFNGPWGGIPVTPTTTNHINNNLKSANPPPGATEQYVGTNRLGNNFVSMPGVSHYTTTHPVNKGPFAVKCTAGGKRKSRRNGKNKRRRTRK